jgi:DNA-binding XRE family transcriptional regulator
MAKQLNEIEQIAHRLELLRLALELTQVGMASRIGNGLTPQKWNNYERGRDRIPVDVAIRLCITSSATLDYIYRGIIGGLPTMLVKRLEELDRPAKLSKRA